MKKILLSFVVAGFVLGGICVVNAQGQTRTHSEIQKNYEEKIKAEDARHNARRDAEIKNTGDQLDRTRNAAEAARIRQESQKRLANIEAERSRRKQVLGEAKDTAIGRYYATEAKKQEEQKAKQKTKDSKTQPQTPQPPKQQTVTKTQPQKPQPPKQQTVTKTQPQKPQPPKQQTVTKTQPQKPQPPKQQTVTKTQPQKPQPPKQQTEQRK